MAAMRANLRRFRFYFTSLVFLSFWTPSSDAAEIITKNQPLNSRESLFSPNRTFVLGFFTPTNSTPTPTNFYFGIWVANDTARQVIWVANRRDPFPYSSGSLIINDSGNLVISSGDAGFEIPITSLTSTSRNTTSAKLLENGNLVLVDEEANGSSRVLWQSFDHPTDTLLPGMKLRNLTSWLTDDNPYPGPFTLGINPNGTSKSNQFVIWYRGVVYWKSRLWNSSEKDAYSYNIHYSFGYEEDVKYFMFTVDPTADDDHPIFKWLMTSSGQISKNRWYISDNAAFWRMDIMEPGSSCSGTSTDDGSSGCVRMAWPKCTGADQSVFSINITTIKFNMFDVNSSIGLTDCEFTCRNNCSCSAYTTANNNRTGCRFRYDDGKELRHEESYTGHVFIRAIGENSRTAVTNAKARGRKRWRIWIIILMPASFIIILLICVKCHVQRARVHREEKEARRELSVLELHANRDAGGKFSDTREEGLDLSIFSFYNVLVATDNFSIANKLGEGGFGPVYKGKLLNGQDGAVKRLCRGSRQGLEEFKNEILLISKLQHKNLVKLIGMCIHGEEKILIYEYMPNKSLDFFLFDPTKREILDWENRVHIIDGIAQGLLYLHKYSRLTVIHRDLKASNILLDGDMNPKISDFGMARMFSGNELKANTNRVVGTYGYMSPEYAMEGLFSVKSDVFSFGVLLLEIMTGKKNTSFHQSEGSLNLLGYAWELWNEGRGLELIDPILVDSSPASELMRCIHVALLCVQERATDRPTMSEVILFLSNQNPTILSPRRPAFFIGRNVSTSLPAEGPKPSSVNDVTISTMDGR